MNPATSPNGSEHPAVPLHPRFIIHSVTTPPREGLSIHYAPAPPKVAAFS